jgi:ABC-type molybdate transport system substrate-binding protein
LLDAALVWNAVAFQFRDRLEVLPVENRWVDGVTSATYGWSDLRNIRVTIGITTPAKGKKAVKRFFEYATTKGREVFLRNGFATAGEP